MWGNLFMELNLKLRKRSESCKTPISISVPIGLRDKIEEIKRNHNIDFNDAARQVLEDLAEKIRTGQLRAE